MEGEQCGAVLDRLLTESRPSKYPSSENASPVRIKNSSASMIASHVPIRNSSASMIAAPVPIRNMIPHPHPNPDPPPPHWISRSPVSWPIHPPGLIHRGTNTSPGLAVRESVQKTMHPEGSSDVSSEEATEGMVSTTIEKTKRKLKGRKVMSAGHLLDGFEKEWRRMGDAEPVMWREKGVVKAPVSYERTTRDKDVGTQTEAREE